MTGTSPRHSSMPAPEDTESRVYYRGECYEDYEEFMSLHQHAPVLVFQRDMLIYADYWPYPIPLEVQ